MAIENADKLAEEHFDAKQFDDLAGAHGTQVNWRRARTCPCLNERSGQPRSVCSVCHGDGVLWEDPGSEITIFGPGRLRRDEYDLPGLVVQGAATFTFPSTITPGHYDQIQMLAARMVVNGETHVRGKKDPLSRSLERLRFRNMLSVEFCEAIINDALEQYATPDDFSIGAGGEIEWVTGKGPPDGAQYSIRYQARPTWVVWAVQSRDEGGGKMPYRAITNRLDFFRPLAVGE